MTGFRIFPVRHHSPTAARLLRRAMLDDPPEHVLIEGPADASRYTADLVAQGTRPPVALLYFIRGRAASCLPFTAFSPEYQALLTADRLGIPARFCDMPLHLRPIEPPEPPPPVPPADAPLHIERGPLEIEWEREFELTPRDLSTYLEMANRLGEVARSKTVLDRTREAYMYKVASHLAAGGVDPAKILIVCGAAHAPALARGDVDLTLLNKLESQGDADVYLVPYSFRRFSSVLGYGAGTSYPHFYQALWDFEGNVEQAACQMLTEIGRDLARAGHDSSLSDTIDAMMFAKQLAALRRKCAPGPEEIVQAVESCLTRGHYGRAAGAVTARLVGDRLGCVAASANKAPLAREFYDYINHPQRVELLPLTDQVTGRTLDLARPRHREVSRFLHRLFLLDVPYADPEDPLAHVVRTIGQEKHALAHTSLDIESLGSLSRTNRKGCEAWVLRWRPQLDSALAEASGQGATLEEAAVRAAEKALRELSTALQAVALYLEVDRAGLDRMVLPCLTAVEQLARGTTDLRSLVIAAREVVTALRYGAGFASPERTRALASVLVRRALELIGAWPRIPEGGVREVVAALEDLAEMRAGLEPGQTVGIERLLRHAARSHALQPELAGAAAAIAFRHRLMRPLEVASELMDRLVADDSLVHGATYLAALLTHSREGLLTSTEATDAMRDFVLRLPELRFLALLPVLRKGFQMSSNSEIRYFMAMLVGAPGSEPRKPSLVTRRINARVESGAYAGLEEWMRHAAAV